ncbi:MAG: aminodeoxychorismate synthase component I [Planctomycetota bacterium]
MFEFRSGRGDPFEQLERRLGKYRPVESASNQPTLPDGLFCGGWIGWFGYELGRYIERLPQTTADDLAMPLIRLCFYDRLLAYDHRCQTFWLVALEMPDDSESPEAKMAALEQLLDESRKVRSCPPQHANIEHIDLSKARANMAKADYLQAMRRIKRYIRDGDVYQVNFSQRFDRPFTGRAIDLFHWQNRHNPSPYAAYVDAGQFQIVSASPEMFVTIRDGLIQTKPIKGTRRRRADGKPEDEFNRHNLQDLLTDEKEQAELNMIIDLERNDIAKICRPGTRRVIQPRTIETYPTVFHAVATVGGQLRRDVGLADILKAVFPGGSITGAPKIRAMEIIDELEPTARGLYTGSIGFLGLDGTVCLNIAIRTVIIAAHKAFVQTGGGIVADSDPEAEWEETITKARALLAGIEAVQEP